MFKPRILKRTDKVVIVAPGGRVNRDVLDGAIERLNHWGLSASMGRNILSGPGYFSGTDAQRHEDLQAALDAEDISAIFCARGGYGTTRILDRIDFKGFRNHPKWVVGFSDITALHLELHKQGFESIHAIMPSQFAVPEAENSLESLRNILFKEVIHAIEVPGNKYNTVGRGTGEVVGGNLSLIVDSLGTRSEIETKDRLLVLEEVDEYKYKVDRMLTQLKRAGKLDHLRGLIVGQLSEIKDTKIPFGASVEEMLLDRVDGLRYPVAFGFPVGHGFPNIAWRHGGRMMLNVTSDSAVLRTV